MNLIIEINNNNNNNNKNNNNNNVNDKKFEKRWLIELKEKEKKRKKIWEMCVRECHTNTKPHTHFMLITKWKKKERNTKDVASFVFLLTFKWEKNERIKWCVGAMMLNKKPTHTTICFPKNEEKRKRKKKKKIRN